MSRPKLWLRHAAPWLFWGMGIGAVACTSARENRDYPATSPGTAGSDTERKAIYNQGAISNTPASVPQNLNNQASEVNRQKNIERRGPDQPNNRPLEVRTEELGRPPVDTLEQGRL